MIKETNYSLSLVREAGTARFKSGAKTLGLYRCACGNEKVIVKSMVDTGRTRSCGCLRRDKTAALADRNRKPPGEAALTCVYTSYVRQAARRKLTFEFSRERFKELALRPCNYCGAPPSQSLGKTSLNGDFIYNGIDRMDGAEGYTESNSVTCCKTCNFAKHVMGHDQFLAWVTKVYRWAIQCSRPTTSEKTSDS